WEITVPLGCTWRCRRLAGHERYDRARTLPKEGFSYEASRAVVSSCGAALARSSQRPAHDADVQRMVVLLRGQRERLLGVHETKQHRSDELERSHGLAPDFRHV